MKKDYPYHILTMFLVGMVCGVLMLMAYNAGFKAGVIAGWECHTDMECENLERLVNE